MSTLEPEIFGETPRCDYCNEYQSKIYSINNRSICSLKHFSRAYWKIFFTIFAISAMINYIIFLLEINITPFILITSFFLFLSIYGNRIDKFETNIEIKRTDNERNQLFNEFLLNSN